MFDSIRKLWKKSMTPKEIEASLKETIYKLNKEIHGLNHDCKKSKKQQEAIVQRGVQLAKQGDSFGRQQAASELRAHNLRMQKQYSKRNQVVASKAVAEIALTQVQYCQPDGVDVVMQRVMGILDSEELQRIVMKADMNEQELVHWLEGQMSSSEDQLGAVTIETSNEELLFTQLAQAEERGDLEEVAKITSKLTQVSPSEGDGSKYDGLEL